MEAADGQLIERGKYAPDVPHLLVAGPVGYVIELQEGPSLGLLPPPLGQDLRYPDSSSPGRKEGIVSDNTANRPSVPTTPTTIAEVIRDIEPMGDLSRFVIKDLTPEEEDEFCRILEDA